VAEASSRLRVVVVRSLLTETGGAEHTATLFATGLAARGYDVHFITRPPVQRGHSYARALAAAGIPLLAQPRLRESPALVALAALARPCLLLPYLAWRRKPLRESWASLGSILETGLARLERALLVRRLERLRRGRPLLVHVFGPDGLLPHVAAWGRATSVPVVYTETVEGDAAAVETFSLRWTVEAINDVPLVICCGRLMARNLREVYGYRGEIAEIPFLIEDPRGEPEPRPPGPRTVLGCVGRLVEHKGFHHVVWALARLRGEGHDVELVIGGSGPMRERLEALAAELGITASVRLLGRFGHVSEVLGQIDVFVLFSSSEAQPLAITEAMAYGKPVVSTRFGGIPDVVEDGASGVLVPPGDRDALLVALRRLVLDPGLRRDMGARARRLFVESRSASVVLGKLEGQYRRLLPGAA
jgi:glycosyltransferase involved in cell wall biosynthesis